MRARRRARQPADHRARPGIEVRRAQPLKGRHGPHVAAVGHRGGERGGVLGVGDDAEAVTQPEHRRARGDRGPLEAERPPAVALPEHQRVRAVHREERLRSGVEVDHRRRAVGDLHLARREPEVSHHRRLLIAHDGGERRGADAEVAIELAQDAAGIDEDGHRGLRDAQRLQCRGIPGALEEVVEAGAGRVGRIGRLHAPAGQPGGQPRVQRPAAEAAGTDTLAAWVHTVEEPLDLARRHERSDEEPLRHQLAAAILRARVLPGESDAAWAPRCRLPDDRRRALGRQPDASHVGRSHTGGHGPDDVPDGGEERVEIVLDQPGRGTRGQGLAVGLDEDAAGLVEQERPHPGGADVEREDEPLGAAGHRRVIVQVAPRRKPAPLTAPAGCGMHWPPCW